MIKIRNVVKNVASAKKTKANIQKISKVYTPPGAPIKALLEDDFLIKKLLQTKQYRNFLLKLRQEVLFSHSGVVNLVISNPIFEKFAEIMLKLVFPSHMVYSSNYFDDKYNIDLSEPVLTLDSFKTLVQGSSTPPIERIKNIINSPDEEFKEIATNIYTTLPFSPSAIPSSAKLQDKLNLILPRNRPAEYLARLATTLSKIDIDLSNPALWKNLNPQYKTFYDFLTNFTPPQNDQNEKYNYIATRVKEYLAAIQRVMQIRKMRKIEFEEYRQEWNKNFEQIKRAYDGAKNATEKDEINKKMYFIRNQLINKNNLYQSIDMAYELLEELITAPFAEKSSNISVAQKGFMNSEHNAQQLLKQLRKITEGLFSPKQMRSIFEERKLQLEEYISSYKMLIERAEQKKDGVLKEKYEHSLTQKQQDLDLIKLYLKKMDSPDENINIINAYNKSYIEFESQEILKRLQDFLNKDKELTEQVFLKLEQQQTTLAQSTLQTQKTEDPFERMHKKYVEALSIIKKLSQNFRTLYTLIQKIAAKKSSTPSTPSLKELEENIIRLKTNIDKHIDELKKVFQLTPYCLILKNVDKNVVTLQQQTPDRFFCRPKNVTSPRNRPSETDTNAANVTGGTRTNYWDKAEYVVSNEVQSILTSFAIQNTHGTTYGTPYAQEAPSSFQKAIICVSVQPLDFGDFGNKGALVKYIDLSENMVDSEVAQVLISYICYKLNLNENELATYTKQELIKLLEGRELDKAIDIAHNTLAGMQIGNIKNTEQLLRQCQEYIKHKVQQMSPLLRTSDVSGATRRGFVLDRRTESGLYFADEFNFIDKILNYQCQKRLCFEKLDIINLISSLSGEERLLKLKEILNKYKLEKDEATRELESLKGHSIQQLTQTRQWELENRHQKILEQLMNTEIMLSFVEELIDLAKTDAAEEVQKKIKTKQESLNKDLKTIDQNINQYCGLRYAFVILYGPCATAKSFFPKVFANELGLPYYEVNLNKINSKYVGETERDLEKFLHALLQLKNAVLNFDELDGQAISAKNSGGGGDYSSLLVSIRNRLQTFLADNMTLLKLHNVFLFGSTNNLQNIPQAIKSRAHKVYVESAIKQENIQDIIKTSSSNFVTELTKFGCDPDAAQQIYQAMQKINEEIRGDILKKFGEKIERLGEQADFRFIANQLGSLVAKHLDTLQAIEAYNAFFKDTTKNKMLWYAKYPQYWLTWHKAGEPPNDPCMTIYDNRLTNENFESYIDSIQLTKVQPIDKSPFEDPEDSSMSCVKVAFNGPLIIKPGMPPKTEANIYEPLEKPTPSTSTVTTEDKKDNLLEEVFNESDENKTKDVRDIENVTLPPPESQTKKDKEEEMSTYDKQDKTRSLSPSPSTQPPSNAKQKKQKLPFSNQPPPTEINQQNSTDYYYQFIKQSGLLKSSQQSQQTLLSTFNANVPNSLQTWRLKNPNKKYMAPKVFSIGDWLFVELD